MGVDVRVPRLQPPAHLGNTTATFTTTSQLEKTKIYPLIYTYVFFKKQEKGWLD
jgi:hypothetical protein